MTSESRNLDVLRSVAVLSVFVSHLLFNVFRIEHLGIFAAHELGRMGVLIFFVHTALVLMLSLERTDGHRPFLNFYIRRAFRIFPLSISCILAVTLLHLPPMPDGAFHAITVPEFLSNLFLVQNVTGHRVLLGPLWSLPYEVQMYAVLPFLFFWVRTRSLRTIAAVWCLTVALQASALVPQMRPVYDLIRFVPWFLGGVFVYRASKINPPRFSGWLWPVALSAVFVVHAAMWTGDHVSMRRNIGEYAVCGLLSILLPMFRDLPTSKLTEISRIIAKYSYGLYLFHPPILWFAFVRLKGVAQWPMMMALMVAVPVLGFHLIEAPLMRYGRKLAQRAQAIQAESTHPISLDSTLLLETPQP